MEEMLTRQLQQGRGGAQRLSFALAESNKVFNLSRNLKCNELAEPDTEITLVFCGLGYMLSLFVRDTKGLRQEKQFFALWLERAVLFTLSRSSLRKLNITFFKSILFITFPSYFPMFSPSWWEMHSYWHPFWLTHPRVLQHWPHFTSSTKLKVWISVLQFFRHEKPAWDEAFLMHLLKGTSFSNPARTTTATLKQRFKANIQRQILATWLWKINMFFNHLTTLQ